MRLRSMWKKQYLQERKNNKKSKENHSDTNVISRNENVNINDFDMEYNFGKNKKCILLLS